MNFVLEHFFRELKDRRVAYTVKKIGFYEYVLKLYNLNPSQKLLLNSLFEEDNTILLDKDTYARKIVAIGNIFRDYPVPMR